MLFGASGWLPWYTHTFPAQGLQVQGPYLAILPQGTAVWSALESANIALQAVVSSYRYQVNLAS